MKPILNWILLIGAFAVSAKEVIDLGEIRIQGNIDKPTVSFVIPRVRFETLKEDDSNKKGEKENGKLSTIFYGRRNLDDSNWFLLHARFSGRD